MNLFNVDLYSDYLVILFFSSNINIKNVPKTFSSKTNIFLSHISNNAIRTSVRQYSINATRLKSRVHVEFYIGHRSLSIIGFAVRKE